MKSKTFMLVIFTSLFLFGIIVSTSVHDAPEIITTQEIENEHYMDENRVLNDNMKIEAFNLTGSTFNNATVVSPNTDIEFASVDSSGYTAFNISLIEGYYFGLNAIFEIDVDKNQGDIDVDILFSDGTLWLSATSNDDNETIGMTEIPETDEYIIVFYPYNSVMDDTIPINSTYNDPLGNTINALEFIMQDYATAILDNFIDFNNDQEETILARMPELVPSNTTWYWENKLFRSTDIEVPSHHEYFKIWLFEDTKVNITLQYHDGGLYDDNTIYLNYTFAELVNYEDYILLGENGPYEKYIGNNIIEGQTSVYRTELVATVQKSGWFYLKVGSLVFDRNDLRYSIVVHSSDSYDYIDQNDEFDNATSINDEEFVKEGLYVGLNDEDYFKFNVSAMSRLNIDIEFNRFRGNLLMYLHEIDGTVFDTSADDDVNQQSIEITVTIDMTFVLLINCSELYENNYTLYISIGPIDDVYERNNVIEDAKELPGSGEYDLFLKKGDRDYFYLFLFKGDSINITLTFNGTLANINFRLYDNYLNTKATSTNAGSDVESIDYYVTMSGTYIIYVYASSTSFLDRGLDYDMSIDILERDDAFESNNNAESATPIQDGYYDDLILRAGNEDWYVIYIEENELLTVSAKFTGESDLDLILYNNAQTAILSSSQQFSSSNEYLSFKALTTSNYYLRTTLFEGISSYYSLNITLNETNDSWEDNDNFNQAIEVNATYYPDIIARGGDFDYFKIQVPKGYSIMAEITYSIGDQYSLSLLTERQAVIIESDTQLNNELVGPVAVEATGMYYLLVHYQDRGLSSYNLNITLGLSSVLIAPPYIPVGDFYIPYVGGFGTTNSSIVISTVSKVDFIMGAGAGVIGIGVGAGGAFGGSFFIRRRRGP